MPSSHAGHTFSPSSDLSNTYFSYYEFLEDPKLIDCFHQRLPLPSPHSVSWTVAYIVMKVEDELEFEVFGRLGIAQLPVIDLIAITQHRFFFFSHNFTFKVLLSHFYAFNSLIASAHITFVESSTMRSSKTVWWF